MAISVRILTKVILVIFLGFVEVYKFLLLHCQRVRMMLCELCQGRFHKHTISFVNIVDTCAVLRSKVIALLVHTQRVNCLVKQVKKILQTDYFRVIDYSHSFGKPSFTG